MKKLLLLALMFVASVSVWAQNEYEENGHKLAPYSFIGLQGGIQNTFNNSSLFSCP